MIFFADAIATTITPLLLSPMIFSPYSYYRRHWLTHFIAIVSFRVSLPHYDFAATLAGRLMLLPLAMHDMPLLLLLIRCLRRR